MIDLLGEKTALEQTKLIVTQIDEAGLPKKLYKKLVLKVYDDQLKKFTNLNRTERHKRLRNLGIKPSPDKKLQGDRKNGLTPVKETPVSRVGENGNPLEKKSRLKTTGGGE